MKCISCKSTKFRKLFSKDNWSLLRCVECGLVKTQVSSFTDYKHYHRDNEYQQEKEIFKNIFNKRFKIISKIKPSPARVLDIGSSTGTMLDIFKSNGYQTYGIEPSGSFIDAQKKGHKIFHTTIEKAQLKSNYFDIVIINHTLEHVENPQKVLQIIKIILKKGGVVYIDVPNFGSISSSLARENWKYLLPNEHVHHFEPHTLSKIVMDSGLHIKYQKTWSGVFDVSNPLSLFIYKLTHFKKSLFEDFLYLPGNILATLINKGTNLIIIATK